MLIQYCIIKMIVLGHFLLTLFLESDYVRLTKEAAKEFEDKSNDPFSS